MDKRVMLAVAGAGKTFTLCKSIDINEKNLILAYTNENVHNITNELIKAHGQIPEKTTVMTFDRFIYNFIVCPYEATIRQFFKCEEFRRRGITISKPPEPSIKVGEFWRKNSFYCPKGELGHYHKEGRYYCDLLSELIMDVKNRQVNLVKKAITNLNILFDKILIDEFQDFRNYDYELINAFIKYSNNILLVGDYYQHSVLGENNSGKPFTKIVKGKKGKKQIISYHEYIELLESKGVDVDTKTLSKTRRCPEKICQFISKKLGIEIEADNDHKGEVIFLEGDSITKVLNDDSVVKLVRQESHEYSFKAVNWSYSKGDTYSNICVILSDNFDTIDGEKFSPYGISPLTINKMYVAMSRTAGNLYLVKWDEFKKIQDRYRNSN